MVQAVAFGIGLMLILMPPLRPQAMSLMPWMIAATFVISVPIAAAIAPKLRSRRFKARHGELSAVGGGLLGREIDRGSLKPR